MTRYQLSRPLTQLIPIAHERAVRGAELVAKGRVTQIAGGPQFFVAGSRGSFYVVDLTAGSCNCPDGRAPHDHAGRKYCKHVCAALLSIN